MGYQKDLAWAQAHTPQLEKYFARLWCSCKVTNVESAPIGSEGHTLDTECVVNCTIRLSSGVDIHVALRLRRHKNSLGKGYDDFTLRKSRPNGTKTEIEKLLERHARKDAKRPQYFAYGHLNESETELLKFRLVNLTVFLNNWKRVSAWASERTNPDGVVFWYWSFKRLTNEGYLAYDSTHSIRLVRSATPIISALKGAKIVVIDTETAGLHPHRDGKILAGVGVKVLDGPSFYLPIRHEGARCRCAQTWKTGPKTEICAKCEHDAFAHKKVGDESWVCPVEWPEVNADPKEISRLAKALKGKTIIMHNAKFDMAVLHNDGLNLTGERILDTIVLWRLISENEPTYKLKVLAKKYLDPKAGESEQTIKSWLRKYHGSSNVSYMKIPAQLIVDYVGDDLDYPGGLYSLAMPKIKEYGLEDLLAIEEKVTKSLYAMERRGFSVDREWVEERLEKLAPLVDEANETCRKRAGERLAARMKKKPDEALKKAHKVYLDGFDALNVHHVKALYEGLGIKSWKLTDKKNPSWNNDVLMSFVRDGDTLAAAILRYRALHKIKKTYYQNIHDLTGSDNLIHCNIRQAGTKQGRVSCADPNLQNLPLQEKLQETWSAEELAETARVQAEMAKTGRKSIDHTGDLPFSADQTELDILSEVRGSFVPRPEYGLLLADWDQVELRILANYANEETMIRAFACGVDIHALTARAAFGEKPSGPAEAKRWRRHGKDLNFGLVFGMGVTLLGIKIDATTIEAKEFKKAYFERYPRIQQFGARIYRALERRTTDTCLRHGSRDLCPTECNRISLRRGWLRNMYGRRRFLGEKNEKLERSSEFYKGINVLVQGTAGDLMRDTFWTLDEALDTGAVLDLVVHDEFIIDTPLDAIESTVKIAVPIMETCPRLTVPLKVSLKWAPKRWSQAIDLDCETCRGLGKTFGLDDDELFDLVYHDKALPESKVCEECNGRRFLLEKAK